MLTRLLKRLGLRREPEPQKYSLEASLHLVLNSLAEAEQRSPDEIATDLLGEALSRRQRDSELWRKWESLSSRQQQVAALICLGNTNRQIAAKLGISIATVHTHSGNIQGTFGVKSKADLRYLLAGWDFNSWER